MCLCAHGAQPVDVENQIVRVAPARRPAEPAGETEPGAAVDHVLAGFSEAEERLLAAVLERAEAGVLAWARDGIDATMNRFNAATAELEPCREGC